MSICKCKKCKDAIITTEHLEDKKQSLCIPCLMKHFRESRVDGYVICLNCGCAVNPRMVDMNQHFNECVEEQLSEGEKTQ